MALSFAHGVVQWLSADTAGSTYVVSGLPFEPKALRFYWTGIYSTTDANNTATNWRVGMGFAASASSRRAVGTFSQDGAADATTGQVAVDDCCVVTLDGAGNVDGKLDLTALASDGFTLTVDDAAPANMTVFWEAWGGSDVTDVTIGDITEPAATGNQNYSASGFVASPSDPDQVVFFAGCGSSSALGTAEAATARFYAGATGGTASGDNIVLATRQTDGGASSATANYYYTGECVALIADGLDCGARAVLSAWLSAGFQFNWLERATTGRRSIYMAIKGGRWDVGALSVPGTTGGGTASVSGLSFAPVGLSTMLGGGTVSTQDTPSVIARASFGSGDTTTSRRAISAVERNALATMDVDQTVEYDQVAVSAINSGAELRLDISAMASDGFTLVVDTTGGTATSWLGYVTFGSAPAATQYDLDATAGTVTTTGQATTVTATRNLTGAAGTVTTAGQSATLSLTRGITASAGTVSAAGQSATVTVARALVATAGTVTSAGQSATLTLITGGTQYDLDATAGAVTTSGQASDVTVTRALTVAAGGVAASGQTVGVTVQRSLVAAPGTVALTGQSVDLTSDAAVVYALDVAPATVAMVGQSVTLTLTSTGYAGGGDPGYRKAKGPTPNPPADWELPPSIEKRIRRRVPTRRDLWVAPAVVTATGGACGMHAVYRVASGVQWDPWEMPTAEMEDALLLAVLG